MNCKVLGIIPARYASTRFPGKPLAMIAGKTMIERVYTQAKKANLTDVIVATDDERIAEAVRFCGGLVVLTSPNHLNGTERCAEAAKLYGKEFDAVINIQGDEPIIAPEQINAVVALLNQPNVQIATLKKRIDSLEILQNPTIVKVVSSNNKAIYFSRSPIPFFRNDTSTGSVTYTENWLQQHPYFKHIGIYGFQKKVLNEVVTLSPTPLETAEQLEQLRWLENGYTIHIAETTEESYSVDVPSDISTVEKFIKSESL